METVFAKDRAEWRRWLAKNGARSEEIWLAFYKKASGKQTVSYEEAVEEALCFGWVDGKKKGLDEECFAFRFTPRKAKSGWSKSNIEGGQTTACCGILSSEAFARIASRRTSRERTTLLRRLPTLRLR